MTTFNAIKTEKKKKKKSRFGSRNKNVPNYCQFGLLWFTTHRLTLQYNT